MELIMAEQHVFIAGYIPDAKSESEEGARRVATAFYAKDMKHARAKASFLFMEEYPGSQDAAYKHLVCEYAEGIPCPELGEWDEDFLYSNSWPEDADHPIANEAAQESHAVDFNKLSETTRIAVLVKYRTTEITSDMLPAAVELLQDDVGTFEGHIVEAISKMKSIVSMYPERVIEAIGYVVETCPPTKKWPEIKAALANWLKQHEQDRKEAGTVSDAPAASENIKMGSGDPERFDLVVALLVMGKDPATSGATDVKNAKHIKESRDPAWRGWRTSLVGIPGIYSFPEKLLYELTLDGMKDLSLIENSEGRLAYVREHFAGHPLLPDYIVDETAEDETEQNEAGATGAMEHESSETHSVEPQHSDDVSAAGTVEAAPHVERTGPFYYRTVAGDKIGRANKIAKLQEVIAQGCVEITQEEHQARKNGTWKDDSSTQEQAAQPEIKNLGGARFSIEGLMGEQPQTEAQITSNEVEKTEVAVAQPAQPAFQSIAAALETDLAEKGDNLKIWRSVMRTDPNYTKDLSGVGFDGTSINAEYMFMRATEIFGPIGTGWGFEVLEDRMLPGAPMSEPIYEDKKFIGNRMLRDADGTLITEQNHSIKIEFWYLDAGNKKRFESYGATKYLYKSKHGVTCDGEAQKKSLTDAIKKALSLLGFSADVWLGLYDQAEYKQENATEFAIKNASDKAGDTIRLRKELDERIERNLETIRSAVTPNEAKGVYSTITREVDVYRKDAQAKADSDFDDYLKKRLLALHRAVDQRVSELEKETKQEQSA
jgi:hypothetical protein